jgi:hypothetical protein
VVVCARRDTGGVPEIGARDQYIPEAGAGDTSGAVSREGGGGNAVYGRCWAGVRCEGVVFRVGAGDESFISEGFGAIADVDRRLSGREAVGSVIRRFGDEAEGFGVRVVGEGWVLSDLGAVSPLLCTGGCLDGFGDGVDSFWDND